MIDKFAALQFQKIPVAPVTLIEVVADQEPQRIIDDAVQVLFADSGPSQHRKRAPDRGRIAEHIGIGEQAQREVSDPRQPVALHAVDQEVMAAEAERVGGVHPDFGQFGIGGEGAPVDRRFEQRAAGDLFRIAGTQIAEGQRSRCAPHIRSGLHEREALLEVGGIAVFQLRQRFAAAEVRFFRGVQFHIGEHLGAGVPLAGAEHGQGNGDGGQFSSFRNAARHGGGEVVAVDRGFPRDSGGAEGGQCGPDVGRSDCDQQSSGSG